jgi:hypothetical protein
MLLESLLTVQGIRCFFESRLSKPVIKESAFRFFIDTMPSKLISLISISDMFQTRSRYARRSPILNYFLNLNFSKKKNYAHFTSSMRVMLPTYTANFYANTLL